METKHARERTIEKQGTETNKTVPAPNQSVNPKSKRITGSRTTQLHLERFTGQRSRNTLVPSTAVNVPKPSCSEGVNAACVVGSVFLPSADDQGTLCGHRFLRLALLFTDGLFCTKSPGRFPQERTATCQNGVPLDIYCQHVRMGGRMRSRISLQVNAISVHNDPRY